MRLKNSLRKAKVDVGTLWRNRQQRSERSRGTSESLPPQFSVCFGVSPRARSQSGLRGGWGRGRRHVLTLYTSLMSFLIIAMSNSSVSCGGGGQEAGC